MTDRGKRIEKMRAHVEALAELARASGDAEVQRSLLEAQRALARALSAEVARSAPSPAQRKRLTPGKQTGTVNKMTPEGRQALSRHRAGDDEFTEAVLRHWPSTREMLRHVRNPEGKVGVSSAFVSRVRAGERSMPEWLAAEIERLCGWPRSKWRR